MTWLLAGLAGAAAVAALLLVRFGVRGKRGVRLLARALHLAASRPRLARLSTRTHAWMYRLTQGRAGQWWFGTRVLVIETKGRRSGQVRQTTIVYVRDGDRFVVTPANAGSSWTPSWWLNLREAGEGTIVVDGERVPVRALEATGAERERLWKLLLEAGPAIADYQSFTSRRFPVVALEPVAGPELALPAR